MADRYFKTVIRGGLPNGLQAFDLTGDIARRELAHYKRSDKQAVASDWKRVGNAMRAAMGRLRGSNGHDVG